MKEKVPVDFIPETYHFVAAGDSLTQGVGDSLNKGGYLHYLEQLLGEERGIKSTEIQNFGIRGNRSSQLLTRLKTTEVKEAVQKADVVMLTIGGNDLMKVVRENFSNLEMRHFEKEKLHFEKNLRSIVEVIRQENKESIIILIGLYNPFMKWFSNVEELNLVMEDWNQTSQSVLAEHPHTYFVDIADIFKGSEENLLYTDYFHPNDRGYELMAGEVYSIIKSKVMSTLSERKYAAQKVGN
ncbi:SGNH/GDSL hydrolase family protein [Bacillus sp. 31A1R]|uniref:SGNH/GDSL hydrolase family protein n=1 Tax=Robertmurraya mangrovi TaxID=3098077 RepID=A0ABU5J169_9BACI|nr:SGNH/GDSL hydrolase family protein [Bacillus sp. 31A1R]MDZ5473117.1 SGNH/GDSL hydrolase family protein [Bacillus sp. 31A1R]